jgi:aspartate aminotransferase
MVPQRSARDPDRVRAHHVDHFGTKQHPLIILGAGEPDFDTPSHVIEAAMLAGDTKYTALDGTAEPKAAIIAKFRRDNGLKHSTPAVALAAGAKQEIYYALLATLDPGDEVIILAPYRTTYSATVDIAGGVPMTIPRDQTDDFKLTAEKLEAAITPKTRRVMLNAPLNPTGVTYRTVDFQALIPVFERHPHL